MQPTQKPLGRWLTHGRRVGQRMPIVVSCAEFSAFSGPVFNDPSFVIMPGSMRSLPRAMLFDMDGTLTAPMLDFPLIKSEMGIGDRPILEAMREMDSAALAAAEAILNRHESRAAAESTLNSGCRELLDLVERLNIRTALITRNSLASVRTVIRRHALKMELVISRDDARPKPDPEALHQACHKLGVATADAWMIGDGQYDVEAGLAAGVPTVWVSHGRPKPFAATPSRTVRDLTELRTFMLGQVDLPPDRHKELK